MIALSHQHHIELMLKSGINPDLFKRAPLKQGDEEWIPADDDRQESISKSLLLPSPPEPPEPPTQSSPRTKPRLKILFVVKYSGSDGCFRNRALTGGPLRDYFHFARSLYSETDYQAFINFAENFCSSSLIDKFTLVSKKFVVFGCLSTARIYEFISKPTPGFNELRNKYQEVKRIPAKKMEIATNLITSLHYDQGKLYIAYLGVPTKSKPSAAYIEVRDLSGKLLHKPVHFSSPIDYIDSDNEFVYFISRDNAIHIHHKRLFYAVRHKFCDLSSGQKVLFCRSTRLSHPAYSRFRTLVITPKGIMVSIHDCRRRQPKQCTRVDNIKSCQYNAKINRYLIHHRSSNSSLIDIGSFRDVFIHEMSFVFEDEILQFSSDGYKLYILTQEKLICIDMISRGVDWTCVPPKKYIDSRSKILVHKLHIVLAKNHSSFYVVNIAACKKSEAIKIKFETKVNRSVKPH